MNNRSKPYNINNKKWINSIYVGCSNSISPPAFTSYQSNRTAKLIISKNSYHKITHKITHEITHKITKRNLRYIDEINSSDSDIIQSSSNNSITEETNSKNKCCTPTTVCCTIFLVSVICICIIIGTIIYVIIKTV